MKAKDLARYLMMAGNRDIYIADSNNLDMISSINTVTATRNCILLYADKEMVLDLAEGAEYPISVLKGETK